MGDESSDVPVAVVSDAEMAAISERMLAKVGMTFDELAACAVEEDFPSELARLTWFALSPISRDRTERR